MNATIASFRRGRHHQHHQQMIVHVEGVTDGENAAALVGKKVLWVSPAGKELSGVISAAHGRKGAVRARFEVGLPGQSLGTSCTIS